MVEKTQIPVTKEVREKLREEGHKGETYTEIIKRLLEKKDESEGK